MAIGRFFAFESSDWIFREGELLPWSDADIIERCRRVVFDRARRLKETKTKREAVVPKIEWNQQTCKSDGDDEIHDRNNTSQTTVPDIVSDKTYKIDEHAGIQAMKNSSEGYETDLFLIETIEAIAEFKMNKSVLEWFWALVHSKHLPDVDTGILALKACFRKSNSFLPEKEKMYLFAVAHYRKGELIKARLCLEECIQVCPDWTLATTLQEIVECKIRRESILGMSICGGAIAGVGLVGLLAGPLVATGLVAGGVTTLAATSWKNSKK